MIARQITQIAVTAGGENNITDVIYALCNDGTLWMLHDPNTRDTPTSWAQLPSPPLAKSEVSDG